MYNNVGLSTARGSGTNAYVQSNVANLSFSRNKIVYNAEENIARAEAEVNKAPNLELLDHEYKRLIEIKCVEFEDLMEGKGFSEEEINSKVSEYRKLLFNEFESGRLNMDAELDLRNSHSRAKVAKQGRSNMRWALGIDASFVDGSSMEKLKKASTTILKEANITQDKAALEKEMEKSMMEKLLEKIKKKREQKKEIKKMKRAMRKKKEDESDDSSSSDSDSLVPKEEPQEESNFTENRRKDYKKRGERGEEHKTRHEDKSRDKNLSRSTAADFFEDEDQNNNNNLPAQYRHSTNNRERNRKGGDDKEYRRKRRHEHDDGDDRDDNRDRYRRRSRSPEYRRERKDRRNRGE
uniref:CWF21 domain-containing protein n=1 Tax=Meloidogyne javanica TaxID=6303 RepID=A0A915MGU8_MELJA